MTAKKKELRTDVPAEIELDDLPRFVPAEIEFENLVTELIGYLPPGPVTEEHIRAAGHEVCKRLGQSYTMREWDNASREQRIEDMRRALEKPPKKERRKRKRGRAELTPVDELVVATLVDHHEYKSGTIDNWTPAVINKIAKPTSKGGPNKAAVSRFFKKKFENGYRGYRATCNKKSEVTILAMLVHWLRDTPERLPTLLPHESGRPDDDE